MTGVLFRPFDIQKWFLVGFTAWLAGLTEGGGAARSNFSSRDWGNNVGDLGRRSGDLWRDLVASSLWITLAAFGCLALLAVLVTLLWISSRGKFMFLDNVVHNRALVVDPWRRFRRQGNSLFFFRIAFTLACIVLIGGLVLAIASMVGFSVWSELETLTSVAIGVTLAGALILLVLVVLYAAFFLDAFVVPLMHRYDVGVLDGWRRFLEFFGQRAWAFLICGLLVFIFGIGVFILIVGFGFMTCCLGFLILMIPYIGTVAMLPILVFYRSFTVEFLAQFDPGLLPEAPPDSPPEVPPLPPPVDATVS